MKNHKIKNLGLSQLTRFDHAGDYFTEVKPLNLTGLIFWWCIKKYAEALRKGDSRSKMLYLRL